MSVSYDFIIVGGGAAGGLLANKLSSHFKIVLIEAGPNINGDDRVRVPAQARSLHGTELDWNYVSEPEPGLNGLRIQCPAGKLLGGSSAINSHVLAHSTKSLHDAWVELGNDDWSWEAIKPYYGFATIENSAKLHAGEYYGSGPLKAAFHQEIHPLQQAWSESCNNSVNGGPGVLMVANAIDANGERSHSGIACIEPVKDRLTIVQGQVNKILFNGNRAVGVQLASGPIYGKEVILCAGAFGSPKILELSGIGHGEHVPSWLDLPVGDNLQDHLNFGTSVEVKDGVTTMDNPKDRDPREGSTYSYIYHSLSSKSLEGLNIEDPFLHKVVFDPNETSATMLMARSRRYTELKGQYVTIMTMYSYPLSRGSSHIVSADPDQPPKIQFQHFSNPVDIEVFARHVLETETLFEGPLKQYIKPGGNRFPQYELNLDSVKQVLRERARTNYHPCGTCSMMAKEKGGVVGQDLRVYGTQGLRVCDASVIPLVPRANILSTVYAIAGKTADIILKEHGKI